MKDLTRRKVLRRRREVPGCSPIGPVTPITGTTRADVPDASPRGRRGRKQGGGGGGGRAAASTVPTMINTDGDVAAPRVAPCPLTMSRAHTATCSNGEVGASLTRARPLYQRGGGASKNARTVIPSSAYSEAAVTFVWLSDVVNINFIKVIASLVFKICALGLFYIGLCFGSHIAPLTIKQFPNDG